MFISILKNIDLETIDLETIDNLFDIIPCIKKIGNHITKIFWIKKSYQFGKYL